MSTEIQSMDPHQHRYNWRERTVQLSWQLDSAHCALEDLGHALDAGDRAAARHIVRSAHEAVGSVGLAVKTLRTQQPPTEHLEQPDAIGSALAIGGSGVATIALDVMVNAMVALAATEDRDETDFLIGACLDAETAYEVSAAVVQAAPRRDVPAMLDLRRAYDTDGSVALRRRVVEMRPRVREISERVAGQALAS
jgi:hypothetical protein